jgi:thymidylate kinase
MGKIIVLMGADGSGKSTLANALQAEMAKRGEKAVVRWATLRPILLRPFILAAKYMMVRKHDKFADYGKHISAKKHGMRKAALLHPVYFAVMFLDYLPQVFVKVVWPKWMGKTVICDRYYHDLMLDYAITVSASPDRMLSLVRFCEKVLPIPDLHYYVTVPVEVALARKDDVPAKDYLVERRKYYDDMAGKMGLPILDGEAPLVNNCSRILSDLAR